MRRVAAFLDIDQAILSKIERGQRKITKEQVIKLEAVWDIIINDLPDLKKLIESILEQEF